MATAQNDNFDIRAPKQIDDRWGMFEAGVWRPFNDVAEAHAKITQRNVGLTCLVKKSGLNVEYWFKDNITALVEKNGGSAYTFSNGLRESGGVVKLGADLVSGTGLLTENTYLIRSNDIGITDSTLIFIADSACNIQVADGPQDNLCAIAFNKSSAVIQKKTTSGSQQLSFEGSSNRIVIDDTINSKGLEYENDYSVNWTDHSLVTKKWVTDNFSGGGGLLTFENGLREDGGVVKLGLDISTAGTTNNGLLTEDTYLILGDPTTPVVSQISISDAQVNMKSFSSINTGSGIVISNNDFDNAAPNFSIFSTVEGLPQSFNFLTGGIVVTEDRAQFGMSYSSPQYRTKGILNDLWIPDWGAVTNYVDTEIDFPVLSVNGNTGAVVLTSDDIASQVSGLGTTITTALTTLNTNKVNKSLSKTITVGTYTLAIEDEDRWLIFTNSGGCTVTVPNQVFADGKSIQGVQRGAGQLTFVAGSGFTLNISSLVNAKTATVNSVFGVQFETLSTGTLYGELELI